MLVAHCAAQRAADFDDGLHGAEAPLDLRVVRLFDCLGDEAKMDGLLAFTFRERGGEVLVEILGEEGCERRHELGEE